MLVVFVISGHKELTPCQHLSLRQMNKSLVLSGLIEKYDETDLDKNEKYLLYIFILVCFV